MQKIEPSVSHNYDDYYSDWNYDIVAIVEVDNDDQTWYSNNNTKTLIIA